jgi:methylenetetrahydrofolate reductase (NADPH)
MDSVLAELASQASIEIGTGEIGDVAKSGAFLAPGRRIFVSHPQARSWSETLQACRVVRDAGLEPVPHVPVRLIADSATLLRILRDLAAHARVEEILLIAGDAPLARGPYSSVAQVLRDPAFRDSGLRRVSFAGHPEGHPRVALESIRRAQREKAESAARLGLNATFVTQFAFEAGPVLAWARAMRVDGVRARLVAGLAGPAKLSTLLKYALRCGVGPSVRALGTNTASALDLVGEERSLAMMRAIAEGGRGTFDGIHFYGFGGFLRTARWLHTAATSLPTGI